MWLPLSALLSASLLYRAHRRRLVRIEGAATAPRRRRRLPGGSRARVAAGVGVIALVLVALPLVPAVSGLGTTAVRYSYAHRFTQGDHRPVPQHAARTA